GFAAQSLFLFNPDKALRSMPVPVAEPAIPRIEEVRVGPVGKRQERNDYDASVRRSFIWLQNLIIQRDAYTLDGRSKQNLERHLQIRTKAFQKSSVISILQKGHIQSLPTIHNEAKVRRSTKSL
ncbi:hypothetical protein BKA65DRAFT_376930, partial [Rhexocercosporidium sp. MPI-PUGE-AT-0058]